MSDSLRHTMSKKDDDTKDVEKQKELSAPPAYDGTTERKDELAADLAVHVEAAAVSGAYERKVFVLNKVMNEDIGMGKFQWQLFVLSGFGWTVDNIFLQGVAIILPQIKRELTGYPPEWATFSLYIGLIIGAMLWGILADIVGRRLSFNVTLFLAGVFGIAAGAAPNFIGLCGLLAALGVGLGGNLPVDGMLFLEFIPGKNQNLLTLLSVFWAIGQLIASLIAWGFIANYSCSDASAVCLRADNPGWRYTFYTLGAITFVLFIFRFAVFSLPESPKFLVAKGRDAEAVAVMREIARRNGKELTSKQLSLSLLRGLSGETVDEAEAAEQEERAAAPAARTGPLDAIKNLVSAPISVARGLAQIRPSYFKPDMSHVYPLFAGKKLAYNTSIVILLWGIIGLAYPLFNAFLPLLLASQSSSTDETYRNYAIISVCGIPGSILAAWMVDLPRSGRRGAMAIGTLSTALFLFGLTQVGDNNTASLVLNCINASAQNIMYGVLYSYTPECFPAPHRGTGDGIASSFNRVTGAMAPIIRIYAAGTVFVPVYVSASLFVIAAVLMCTLQVESRGRTAL
ncbi:unnamed protein product [Tilletia laevis]|nr:unnamed protein product [Tilletia caries]CAD6945183.1 unnamed protein product [Tilletia laevis]